MAREATDVTPTELQLLHHLWDAGPCTKVDLARSLYANDRPSALATVLKLIERLEAKGLVQRAREGRTQWFRAALSRETFVERQLDDFANRMCGGSKSWLLQQLARPTNLTVETVEHLRRLVESWDRGERGP